jgi:hypothetical protein
MADMQIVGLVVVGLTILVVVALCVVLFVQSLRD